MEDWEQAIAWLYCKGSGVNFMLSMCLVQVYALESLGIGVVYSVIPVDVQF